MRKRLSQKAVDNLQGPAGKVCWDLRNPGFGVAIGARFNSYIVQRRVDRATRRITLGRCGDLTYEQALHRARDFLREMEHRRAPRQLTLDEALEEYIASRKD